MFLPPDKYSLHFHLMRVKYITFCLKNIDLKVHPCPLDNGWALINGKCRPIRHSHPALSSIDTDIVDSSNSESECDAEDTGSELEDTDCNESSESDFSDDN